MAVRYMASWLLDDSIAVCYMGILQNLNDIYQTRYEDSQRHIKPSKRPFSELI